MDKLVNRGLVWLSDRLDIPLVATTAVRYARRENALTAVVLEAARRGSRPEGLLGSGKGVDELPTLTLDYPPFASLPEKPA